MKKWEKNYFEIKDEKEKSSLQFYFKFLKSKTFKKLNGDIVEAGVFKGSSLLSTAILLRKKKLLKNKFIWAYDTFKGFPRTSYKDNEKIFDQLYQEKKITHNHYKDIYKLRKYNKVFKSSKLTPKNISTSNNFDNTSFKLVKKKLKLLKLYKYIKLIVGDFDNTMKIKKNLPKKISVGLIDCDLYGGYKTSLKFFWPRLEKKGKLFLDEYYSLKFPGPRIAVNEFVFKNKNAKLIREGFSLDFERWSIQKS
jgi:hypothetical protein